MREKVIGKEGVRGSNTSRMSGPTWTADWLGVRFLTTHIKSVT